MLRSLTRSAIIVAIIGAVVGWGECFGQQFSADDQPADLADIQDGSFSDAAYAGADMCRPWEYGNPALFYNFYVPNYCGGVPAQLYIAPRPVPALVGHTYYTYQPLMPHEFMYPHYRTYRRRYEDCRGLTRTKVCWYRNPAAALVKCAHEAIRLPR